MSQSKPKVTRSIKDILVSHEERLQLLSQHLERLGGNINSTQDKGISTKMKQTEELNKKLMMNQRTFNNSLQLLNGRLSKMEQLFVEFTLELKNLKKEQQNNVSLIIQEEATEETTEGTTEGTTEEATEETTEETTEGTTEEATEETTEENAVDLKDEVKEEVKEEIKKTKKEKLKDKSVIIDENKNEEF